MKTYKYNDLQSISTKEKLFFTDMIIASKIEIYDRSILIPIENSNQEIIYSDDLEKMNNIIYVTPESKSIDLCVLEGFKNLNFLCIANIEILDSTPLRHLRNITELTLVNTAISNIQSLSELYELVFIDLNHNRIRDITPLSSLKHVKALDLRHNEISNIQPLKHLRNLNYLNVSNNRIHDIYIYKSRPLYKPSKMIFSSNPVWSRKTIETLKQLE